MYWISFLGEFKRERDFYRAQGLACPKDAAMINDKNGIGDEPEQPDNTDCHRKDEQVCICNNFIVFTPDYITYECYFTF